MIAAFVAAEVDSRRFRERLLAEASALGFTDGVLRVRDTSVPERNDRRRELLVRYRGWGTDRSVFGGLPTHDVEWWAATITWEGLRHVDVIEYMRELCPGLPTRRLLDLVELGITPAEDADVAATAEAIGSGRVPVDPILVAEPGLGRFVILEGHTRLSAYALVGAAVAPSIDVIVGVTARAAEWSEW